MSSIFFIPHPAPTEIYTLSLHDALPIYVGGQRVSGQRRDRGQQVRRERRVRSEEHTSELQSPDHLVCRLLLEKKKHALRRTSTRQPLEREDYRGHTRVMASSCHITQ